MSQWDYSTWVKGSWVQILLSACLFTSFSLLFQRVHRRGTTQLIFFWKNGRLEQRSLGPSKFNVLLTLLNELCYRLAATTTRRGRCSAAPSSTTRRPGSEVSSTSSSSRSFRKRRKASACRPENTRLADSRSRYLAKIQTPLIRSYLSLFLRKVAPRWLLSTEPSSSDLSYPLTNQTTLYDKATEPSPQPSPFPHSISLVLVWKEIVFLV